LLIACSMGNRESVLLFLSMNANKNVKDYYG
jgi:hypothetical protein